jgi:hypothetical protein
MKHLSITITLVLVTTLAHSQWNSTTTNSNVGIGESSPSYKLDIMNTTVDQENVFRVRLLDAPGDYLRIMNMTGQSGQFIPSLYGYHTTDNRQALYVTGAVDASNDSGSEPIMVFDSRLSTAAPTNRHLFAWDAYGNRKMTMTANGNLGIGLTPNSSYKLHVLGRTVVENEGIYATGDRGSVILGSHSNYYLKPAIYSINTSGQVNDLFINPAGGNVGIGTLNSVNAKLEVNGNILSRMTNGGGWDVVFGAGDGNGLVVGKLNGNTATISDHAHMLYRNADGAIYRGYNSTGVNSVVINSQNSGHSYFASGGYVGIGTNDPKAPLHVTSPWPSVVIDKPNSSSEALLQFWKAGAPQFYFWTDNTDNDGLKIMGTGLSGEHDGSPRMEFPLLNKNIYMAESGGNVGIGTTAPDTKLTVKGTIHTEEVRVDLSVPGPDYVFEKDYDLLSLSEIESYINQHKHLPEVPSAKQMGEEGLNLKEMNLILLKKVEELTLHLIEMNKKTEAVRIENSSLKSQLSQLDELKTEIANIREELKKTN